MKKIYLFFLSFFILSSIKAQDPTRYLEPVFENVTRTDSVLYGANATVLLLPVFGEAVLQPLIMDMYEPTGDTAQLRPLVIFFHTGNFLPHPQNGSIGGSLKDSAAVEICRRLAKTGYVAASADYRLGWNPVAPTKDERVFTLINAAYRGVQDARSCIRYFKKTVAEFGNPWRVDTSRIVLYGQGTGGYVSLNTAILDDYTKILTASNGKFLTSDGQGSIIPMIIEAINGNVNGTTYGIVPPGLPLPFPAGDTLCYPNHPEYSSDFTMGVNLGGAIADSSWIDPGQPPIVSFQCPYDQFAPYVEGLVLVPVDPPLEVVEVQGSYISALLHNQYGNNDPIKNAPMKTAFMQEVTDHANSINDGLEGLYPMYGTGGIFDSAPWEFWDPATNPNSVRGFITNPDMTREKAMLYIDTIMAYSLPRMYMGLNLMNLVSSTEVIQSYDVSLIMYPNPTTDEVLIGSKDKFQMRNITVFNMNGQVLGTVNNIDNNYYNLPVSSFNPGQYIIQIEFDQGAVTKQLIIK